MAKVILFGAGASYGSGDVFPERPPLGGGLFGELARCYPGTWGTLPEEIRSSFCKDFEIGMRALWEGYSWIVPRLMQEMALYFVQFRPRSAGSTLYCTLAKELLRNGAKDPPLISTLNYECLIELAISGQSLTVNYGEFPGPIGTVTVWKLHGSCNFLPEGIQANRSVTFTRDVLFDTSLRVAADLNEVCEFCLADNALPPAMCLFMEGKPAQVSRSSILAIQESWRSIVSAAEQVFLVGVRPNPADDHLWGALAHTPARLFWIGNHEEFSEWTVSHRRGGASEFVANYFEDGLGRLTDEILR